jgi:hypothetical protein
MARARYLLLFTLAGVGTCVGWIYVMRYLSGAPKVAPDPVAELRRQEFLRIYGGKELKILHFYAAEGYIIEGQRVSICYGVLNAKSVRMEPPLDGVGVSLNRCVQDAPQVDTMYTLSAVGMDGSVASESFLIQTRPDAELLPVITRFQLLRSYDDPARKVYLLSFETRNAYKVSIEPAVFPTLMGAPTGRFYVSPERTTTYTLTVADKKGRSVSQKLTVEAPLG